MSYLTQSVIADDRVMQARVAQAAAEQQAPGDPDQWALRYRRTWASAPGWDLAWESALASNVNQPGYEPGSDAAVITDTMVLSQVQAMLAEPAATA